MADSRRPYTRSRALALDSSEKLAHDDVENGDPLDMMDSDTGPPLPPRDRSDTEVGATGGAVAAIEEDTPFMWVSPTHSTSLDMRGELPQPHSHSHTPVVSQSKDVREPSDVENRGSPETSRSMVTFSENPGEVQKDPGLYRFLNQEEPKMTSEAQRDPGLSIFLNQDSKMARDQAKVSEKQDRSSQDQLKGNSLFPEMVSAQWPGSQYAFQWEHGVQTGPVYRTTDGQGEGNRTGPVYCTTDGQGEGNRTGPVYRTTDGQGEGNRTDPVYRTTDGLGEGNHTGLVYRTNGERGDGNLVDPRYRTTGRHNGTISHPVSSRGDGVYMSDVDIHKRLDLTASGNGLDDRKTHGYKLPPSETVKEYQEPGRVTQFVTAERRPCWRSNMVGNNQYVARSTEPGGLVRHLQEQRYDELMQKGRYGSNDGPGECGLFPTQNVLSRYVQNRTSEITPKSYEDFPRDYPRSGAFNRMRPGVSPRQSSSWSSGYGGREPNMKLPVYKGKGDWNNFLVQFESVTRDFQWNDEVILSRLISCLQDQAMEYVAHMSELTRSSLSRFLKSMERRFGDHVLPETRRASLATLKKQSKETLEEFAARTRMLVSRAYPGLEGTDLFEKITVEHMVGGLSDPNITYDIMSKRPQTVEQAIDMIQWHECCKSSLKRKTLVRQVCVEYPSSSDEDDSEPEPAHEIRRVNMKRFVTEERLNQFGRDLEERLVSRLAKVMNEKPGGSSQARGDDKNEKWQETAECYNCHEIGHISRKCPLRHKRRENVTSSEEEEELN